MKSPLFSSIQRVDLVQWRGGRWSADRATHADQKSADRPLRASSQPNRSHDNGEDAPRADIRRGRLEGPLSLDFADVRETDRLAIDTRSLRGPAEGRLATFCPPHTRFLTVPEEAQGAEEAKADLAACASSRSFTNHTRNEFQHDRVEGRRPLKRREMTDLRQYL